MFRRSPLAASLLAATLLLSACSTARPAPAPAPVVLEPEELGEAPTVVESAVTAVRRDLLGTATYDLPVEANSWVEAELDFLVEKRKAVVARWIERGDFYEPFVRSVLKTHGVPTDLIHLAMIESGFIPTARSRAGAVGLWQFMPATGRALGLRVDTLVDERMDPVRSTRAAARHLKGLRSAMGDWALAAAAYNAGSGRISRGLQRFQVGNFWDLAQQGDLAEETKHYVPRLYAVAVINRNRERFGIPAPPSAPRFAYDSIQVEYATPLEELARMTETPLEQLTRLNPHLLRGATPAGGYWVWVPGGQGAAFQRAWLASDFRREQGYGSYAVRPGDTLGRLAELAGVKTSRIRELNPGVDWEELRVGQKLRFPFRAAQELAARPVEKPRKKAAEAEEKPRVAIRSERDERRGEEAEGKGSRSRAASAAAGATHQVREGETLWGIARRYEVEVAVLREANRLGGATIVPGQELRIPGREGGSRASASAPAPRAEEAARHVVRTGDTLWSIAQRYGSTVGAIQSANQLSDGPLQPGVKLTIPK